MPGGMGYITDTESSIRNLVSLNFLEITLNINTSNKLQQDILNTGINICDLMHIWEEVGFTGLACYTYIRTVHEMMPKMFFFK